MDNFPEKELEATEIKDIPISSTAALRYALQKEKPRIRTKCDRLLKDEFLLPI